MFFLHSTVKNYQEKGEYERRKTLEDTGDSYSKDIFRSDIIILKNKLHEILPGITVK